MRQAVPLIFPVLGINMMSLLDAAGTGFLLDKDLAIELNPLMNVLIAHSYFEFLIGKLLITLIGTLICWQYYEHRGCAGTVIKWISRVYCVLMIWHVLLLSGVTY
jgi:Domain of unknown function (DUF5658)